VNVTPSLERAKNPWFRVYWGNATNSLEEIRNTMSALCHHLLKLQIWITQKCASLGHLIILWYQKWPQVEIRPRPVYCLINNYSGRKITASFSCVTERGEGKMEGSRRNKKACFVLTENISPPPLISTQSVAFSCTDFNATLYFVNQRNYKTLAMQAHASTSTRYFYSQNFTISHPIVYKEGLGYLSVCAIASRSSPP
jgi:hypothetical protein